jgi:hypothetical protein
VARLQPQARRPVRRGRRPVRGVMAAAPGAATSSPT